MHRMIHWLSLAFLLCLSVATEVRAYPYSISFSSSTELAAGKQVRAIHITDLRAAINVIRSTYGWSDYTFTDPTISTGTTLVRAVHITEMQALLTAITTTYSQTGQCPSKMTTVTWTVPTAGTTLVSASIMTQLTGVMDAIPTCKVCAQAKGTCYTCAPTGLTTQTLGQDRWGECKTRTTCRYAYCGTSGACAPVASGSDVFSDCTATCGTCDGAGACKCKNDGSSCGSGKTCKGGTYGSCTCN